MYSTLRRGGARASAAPRATRACAPPAAANGTLGLMSDRVPCHYASCGTHACLVHLARRVLYCPQVLQGPSAHGPCALCCAGGADRRESPWRELASSGWLGSTRHIFAAHALRAQPRAGTVRSRCTRTRSEGRAAACEIGVATHYSGRPTLVRRDRVGYVMRNLGGCANERELYLLRLRPHSYWHAEAIAGRHKAR
jgi:hypothetical protein